MDTEIENLVRLCTVCQESRASPPTAPWTWPSEPWTRLHHNFAGPYLGKMYLVLVDAHSKWLEVAIMSSITSVKTIEQLRMILPTHGLPKNIVTDNGPSFISQEFEDLCQRMESCTLHQHHITPQQMNWRKEQSELSNKDYKPLKVIQLKSACQNFFSDIELLHTPPQGYRQQRC